MQQLTYTSTASDKLVVRSDGVTVPSDPDNVDWQAYKAWCAAGNTPNPLPGPTRAVLDGQIREACTQTILAAFSVNGVSMRGSMNLWLGSIVATQIGSNPAALGNDDQTCLTMAPKLNAWESAMFVERDRLIAAALTVADAKWPVFPDGGAAFVASCNQG